MIGVGSKIKQHISITIIYFLNSVDGVDLLVNNRQKIGIVDESWVWKIHTQLSHFLF